MANVVGSDANGAPHILRMIPITGRLSQFQQQTTPRQSGPAQYHITLPHGIILAFRIEDFALILVTPNENWIIAGHVFVRTSSFYPTNILSQHNDDNQEPVGVEMIGRK
jgi:hypothetical protein